MPTSQMPSLVWPKWTRKRLTQQASWEEDQLQLPWTTKSPVKSKSDAINKKIKYYLTLTFTKWKAIYN